MHLSGSMSSKMLKLLKVGRRQVVRVSPPSALQWSSYHSAILLLHIIKVSVDVLTALKWKRKKSKMDNILCETINSKPRQIHFAHDHIMISICTTLVIVLGKCYICTLIPSTLLYLSILLLQSRCCRRSVSHAAHAGLGRCCSRLGPGGCRVSPGQNILQRYTDVSSRKYRGKYFRI